MIIISNPIFNSSKCLQCYNCFQFHFTLFDLSFFFLQDVNRLDVFPRYWTQRIFESYQTTYHVWYLKFHFKSIEFDSICICLYVIDTSQMHQSSSICHQMFLKASHLHWNRCMVKICIFFYEISRIQIYFYAFSWIVLICDYGFAHYYRRIINCSLKKIPDLSPFLLTGSILNMVWVNVRIYPY